jgi:hypothetical protein
MMADQLAKGSALDIPAGYGSQEPGVRIAAVYAPRSRLTSSSMADTFSVSPYPRSLARIRKL